MKKGLILFLLLIAVSSVNATYGIYNNSGSQPADSISLPFYILDSLGHTLQAGASNDSLFVVIWYPDGVKAYEDSMVYTDTRITSEANGAGTVYNFHDQLSDLDGTAQQGVYSYIMIYKDASQSTQMPFRGTFQLLTETDFNTSIEYIKDILDTLQLWDTRIDSMEAALADVNIGDKVWTDGTPANRAFIIDSLQAVIDSLQNQDNWVAQQTEVANINGWAPILDNDSLIIDQSSLEDMTVANIDNIDQTSLAKAAADSLLQKAITDTTNGAVTERWATFLARTNNAIEDTVNAILDTMQDGASGMNVNATATVSAANMASIADSVWKKDTTGYLALTATMGYKMMIAGDSSLWANGTVITDTLNAIIDTLQNQDNWVAKEASLFNATTDSVLLANIAEIANEIADSIVYYEDLNLIPNGGFEDGYRNNSADIPYGWTYVSGGTDTTGYSITAYSGSSSQRFGQYYYNIQTAATEGNIQTATGIYLDSGEYFVSAAVGKGAFGTPHLRLFKGTDTVLSVNYSTDEQSGGRVVSITTAGVYNIRLGCTHSAPFGTATFDNVGIYPLTSPKGALVDLIWDEDTTGHYTDPNLAYAASQTGGSGSDTAAIKTMLTNNNYAKNTDSLLLANRAEIAKQVSDSVLNDSTAYQGAAGSLDSTAVYGALEQLMADSINGYASLIADSVNMLGVGIDSVTLRFVDTSGTDATVQGAAFVILNSAGDVKAEGLSGDTGKVTVHLDPATYRVFAIATGYMFPTYTLTVSADADADTVAGYNIVIDTPVVANTCTVFGWLKKSDGTAIVGAVVTAIRDAGKTAIKDTATAAAIYPKLPITVSSDTLGYWSMTVPGTSSFPDTTLGFFNFNASWGGQELFDIKKLWIPSSGTLNLGDSLLVR